MTVYLPDGTALDLPDGATGRDAAAAIGPGLARAALAVRVGDEIRDLARPLADGEHISIITPKSGDDHLYVMRHSAAHVLAEAVQAIVPGAKLGFGPPIRDGKPYSRIAKLAEDVLPFAAMARGLKAEGFSAPDILAHDLKRGILLVEDFGSQGVVADGAHVPERMEMAVDVLAALHTRNLPQAIAVDDEIHSIPPYDLDALLIETELLLDWYLPHVGVNLAPGHRARFIELWTRVLTPIANEPGTWTLRDYHSPNLMWLPERAGIERIGLLDFQDTVIGHPAYDVVSLLQDARLDVPEGSEMALLTRYVKARRKADPFFDPLAFAGAYAVLGAQRATKILGIFVRLSVRDGKKAYLQHLPRLARYLDRDLAHPALTDLRDFYLSAVRPRR